MRTWTATLACVQAGWVVTATKDYPTRAQARVAVAENRTELLRAGAAKVTSRIEREIGQ